MPLARATSRTALVATLALALAACGGTPTAAPTVAGPTSPPVTVGPIATASPGAQATRLVATPC